MPFDGLETPFGYLARFDQVIDLVEAPGRLVKHTYRNPRGGYCLKEALNVIGVADLFEPIILETAEQITDKEFCCIESFNDHPETVQGDVLAVLHRVRGNIAAGKVRLPPRAAARPAFARDERDGPAAAGRVPQFWRKLFG